MPEIIILAGPNGAGKTSFANEYFPQRTGLAFINADEIARGLSAPKLPQAQLDLRAGREMLKQLDALAAAGAEIMFETTLSTLTYAHRIRFGAGSATRSR
jgi:predicted ABC-type ATPase